MAGDICYGRKDFLFLAVWKLEMTMMQSNSKRGKMRDVAEK